MSGPNTLAYWAHLAVTKKKGFVPFITVVNGMILFSSSLIKIPNKLECLSLAPH
jgi:hypothetical protein